MLKTHPTELLERGWYLLPVAPNSKEPFTKLARKGFYSASNDKYQINSWLEREPNLNWGIACEMSGLLVVDVDYRNLNQSSWRLAKELWAETYQVETGDGIHYYFQANKGLKVPGKLADGIDIKYRGYVVADGSVHENGKTYSANQMPVMKLQEHPILGKELM
jgi:hypothetical protein